MQRARFGSHSEGKKKAGRIVAIRPALELWTFRLRCPRARTRAAWARWS